MNTHHPFQTMQKSLRPFRGKEKRTADRAVFTDFASKFGGFTFQIVIGLLLTTLLVAGIERPTNAEALPAAAQIDALRQSRVNVAALKLNEIMADNGGIVDPANATGGR
ncbi:MAG: hypothetical protein R2911_00215 [Caldilineaceae bacterium]